MAIYQRIVLLVLLLLSLAYATPLPAQEKSPAPQGTPSPAQALPEPETANDRLPFMADSEHDRRDQPSATGLLLRTVGALLLIVGLIVAAGWGMKRFGGARFGKPQGDAPGLAVINSLSLGDRRSLAIVRFGDRTLLLGSTQHSVTLLAEADEGEVNAPMRSVAEILGDEKHTTSEAFADELSNAHAHLNEQFETWRGGQTIA